MAGNSTTDRSPIHLWDAAWGEQHDEIPPSPVVNTIRALLGDRLRGAKVLEIGAGTGKDIVGLGEAGALVYADDLSTVAIEKIRRLADQRGVQVETVNADLRAIPFPDGTFDVVYSVGVVEHFTDVEPVLREQRRLVRPESGFLIVDVPQTFNIWTLYKHIEMLRKKWPYGWETQYSLFDLRRFAARFDLVFHSYYYYGQHLSRLGPLLDVFDHSPYTAMCIGAVYSKPN